MCQGELVCNGTAARPIRISGDKDWGNIAIISHSDEQGNRTEVASAQLTYVTISGGSGLKITSRTTNVPASQEPVNKGWIKDWTHPGGGWITQGGGLLLVGADANVDHCTITNCSAEYGGGVQVRAEGKVVISNCEICHNTAQASSGGGAAAFSSFT